MKSDKFSRLPIVHEAQLLGDAYGAHPFDTTIPQHYLYSKNFSGGSNVRSPQYVRRWNMLNKSDDTAATLFGRSFYSRVLLPEGFASALATQLKSRGQCFEAQSTAQPGLVRLERGKCPALTLVEAVYQDSPSIWWSTPQGFLFKVYGDSLGEVNLYLAPPFGKFAVPHRVEVTVTNLEETKISTRRVTVNPGSGYRLKLTEPEFGDSILIRSIDRCPVPYEIDSERFLDRRELCVGIVSVVIDGVDTPLASIAP